MTIAGAALFAVTLLIAPSAHAAYQCKTGNTWVEGIGVYSNVFAATAMAKAKWKAAAQDKYGLAWSVWDISSRKNIQCNTIHGGFHCRAVARPCLYATG